MPCVRDTFWRGQEFTLIEHMQTEAVTWAQHVAGRRQCRPLGGAAPMAVFGAVEAAALLPLPPTPFTLARWSTATVGAGYPADSQRERLRPLPPESSGRALRSSEKTSGL
ncbi:hypothetical protein [Streptomyces sp. ME18-1-4]|uniref:hypothetical protein n=1 Tax=Streptomyces sp. ME18-1-4 TaxID=3028685 RepID=UPI0029AD3337|nr:hypothetical protein [Streptomyces sp. ME18-1-4]MDX3245697.1 hypothetical protein [Streptomyces sp. ME18-1-4]